MNNILYLGLEVPEDLKLKNNVIHCPLIKIIPRSLKDFKNFPSFTHVIFTSKSAVTIFMDNIHHFEIDINNLCRLAVGKMTAAKMAALGIAASHIAEEESGEGMVALMKTLDLSQANIFWPHSAQSRTIITDWLNSNGIAHYSLPLYDTVANIPKILPSLINIDEIVFTSPSTVDAFLLAYGTLPKHKKLTAIGPVTEKRMNEEERL